MRTRALGALCVVACVCACGGRGGGGGTDGGTHDAGSPGGDAGPMHDGGPGTDGGPGVDAGPGVDGGPTPDGGPAACTPLPGTGTYDGYCDLFELAILAHDGAPTEARLSGRVMPSGAGTPTCAVIDGVDVLTGGVGSAV